MSSPQRPEMGEPVPRRTGGAQAAIIMLGLVLGLLMMGIQLWLLTIAFDLYRSGERLHTVVVAAFSGLVFLGGVLMLRLIDRGPRPNG